MNLPYHQSSEIINRYLLSSQLLACAVSRSFPNALLAGGGINSLGFYYDFIFEQPLQLSMIEFIEVQVRALVKENLEIRSLSIMRENAQSLFEYHGHPALAMLAVEKDENILNLLQVGEFYGICPELPFARTEEAGYIKLLEFDVFPGSLLFEKKTVTRISGTAQSCVKELKAFIKARDVLLKKKDHRVLGPQLNLFSHLECLGELGLVWHPKGVFLRRFLQDLVAQESPLLYQSIETSSVLLKDFVPKGDSFCESFEFEERDYQLTSSLTLQHVQFLKSEFLIHETHPKRVIESASLYFNYPGPQRWGLLCSSSSLLQQATVSCLKEQVVPELISSLHFIRQMVRIFPFEACWVLVAPRLKSQKSRLEQRAFDWLKEAAHSVFPDGSIIIEETDKEIEGPRFELRVRDSISREWTLSTISVVTNLFKRKLSEFFLDDSSIILTRSVWESLERVIALLIEHYEGKFPVWLAPEQVRLIAVGDASHRYAREVKQQMQLKGLRVGLDLRPDKLASKIHEAEREKIPYLVLIGEHEELKKGVSVRSSSQKNQSQFVELDAFINRLYEESLCPTTHGITALIGESELA